MKKGKALIFWARSICLSFFALSVATLGSIPSAYGADTGGVSPSEFNRYQVQQELELEREQAVRGELNTPKSAKQIRSQQQQFEAERLHQRQLLERQRRWVAGERAKSRLSPRRGSSRGITLQQLQREQSSERLGRELAR